MIIKDDLFYNQPVQYNGDLSFPDFSRDKTVVILDDDPVGNQTVHGAPVLFRWDTEIIASLFAERTPAFFILLNTKWINQEQVGECIDQVMECLNEARDYTGRNYVLVSRSDNILKGNYPLEPERISRKIEHSDVIQCFIPAFFQAGRYTCNDIYYVQEGEALDPIAETAVAKDIYSGPASSNMLDFVIGQYNGHLTAKDVYSFSLGEIRGNGPEYIREVLLNTSCCVCIVNAIEQADLDVFSSGAWQAICRGRKMIFRVSASFISSFTQLPELPLLEVKMLEQGDRNGGLILAGNDHSKTGNQVALLIAGSDVFPLELDVTMLLSARKHNLITELAKSIRDMLLRGRNVLVYASLELKREADISDNFSFGQEVTRMLVQIVRRLNVTPSFCLSIGRELAHTIAADGLRMEQAVVSGKLLPGISVYESADERSVKQIVFPENIGDDGTLLELYELLKGK